MMMIPVAMDCRGGMSDREDELEPGRAVIYLTQRLASTLSFASEEDKEGGRRTLFATENGLSRDCLAHGEMKKRRNVAGKR